MAYLDLVAQWVEQITQLQIDDDVLGGPDGIWNKALKELGDRTEWLKVQADTLADGLDEMNGEVIEPDIAAKMERLIQTRLDIISGLRDMGLDIPDDISLSDLGQLIVNLVPGGDVSNIVNQPWFNPGTQLGGIAWADPSVPFDYIEITDVLNDNAVIATIDPGIQFFEPPAGTFRFRIRARLPSGNYTVGVLLPETTYAVVYTANLLSITIPMSAANQIVLAFDNFVKITDAAGFSVSGISDSLVFVDQPDVKTIRLRLATKYFSQGGTYTLSYDPLLGNALQNNDGPIAEIVGHSIDNYADYSPAEFVSAQIPQAQPATLVLVMSRPIHITNLSAFSISGTTAQIASLVSEGATVELALNEPVDSSAVEPTVKISHNGSGAVDDTGQAVEAFSNRAVTNNSTHTAISIQSSQVPSGNSQQLIVVMQGAVNMSSAAGWSLESSDQNGMPNLSQAAFSISDGTITFTLPVNLLAGKHFTVAYNGEGNLRATATNDKIRAFSQSVANNSTDTGGIGPGVSPRNLAIVVLGREPQTPAEVTQIFTVIKQTIASGQVASFVGGDYFDPVISPAYPFTVAAGYTQYGAINLTANADLGEHGKHIRFQVISKNGHKGKNGVAYDHIWIDLKNVPGYSTSDANAQGHYMEATNINTNGFAGSQGRLYLDSMKAGLQALGVPFNEAWIKAVPRRVSKGGSPSPGYDLIQDKLILPTEYEMHGAHTYSDSTQEDAANQGRFEYYDSNAKRIKYDRNNTARYYWCASPRTGYSSYFCIVGYNGSANNNNSNTTSGFAPAFCVAGA